MTVLRELIFEEIERRLNAVANIGEVERMPSGDPATFPALHIYDGGQRPGLSEAQASRYDMAVTIEGFIEQSSGADAHAALNALYGATVLTMMTEPPLGGLAETIDEGPMQIEVAPLSSTKSLAFSLDFYVNFPTRRGDPAQPA